MTGKQADLLVLGGGPGGYTAALRGARYGLDTILVERGKLGGTCLHRGCIPTKALMEDTMKVASLRACGFMKGKAEVSLRRMRERREELSRVSMAGLEALLSERGVRIIRGDARFTAPLTVSVQTPNGTESITAKEIVLATGAREEYEPSLVPEGEFILHTDHALNLDAVPRTLAVIGAGSRGVEFARIFRNLGSEVLLIERQKRIVPSAYWEISDRLKNSLLNSGIRVMTQTTMLDARRAEGGGSLALESNQGRKDVVVEKVILTGKRRPDYAGLALEAAGLAPRDLEKADGSGLKPRVNGVSVIGDAAGEPYLAHKAIVQGMAAADRILGKGPGANALLIPQCIYGDPEAAWVGMTGEQALASGRSVKVAEFPFAGNGRAGTFGKAAGTVMMVTDARTGEVLGVHMIGPGATELIAMATLAMQNSVDVECIRKTVFPHPTLSETFLEAALAMNGDAIHVAVEPEELTPEG